MKKSEFKKLIKEIIFEAIKENYQYRSLSNGEKNFNEVITSLKKKYTDYATIETNLDIGGIPTETGDYQFIAIYQKEVSHPYYIEIQNYTPKNIGECSTYFEQNKESEQFEDIGYFSFGIEIDGESDSDDEGGWGFLYVKNVKFDNVPNEAEQIKNIIEKLFSELSWNTYYMTHSERRRYRPEP